VLRIHSKPDRNWQELTVWTAKTGKVPQSSWLNWNYPHLPMKLSWSCRFCNDSGPRSASVGTRPSLFPFNFTSWNKRRKRVITDDFYNGTLFISFFIFILSPEPRDRKVLEKQNCIWKRSNFVCQAWKRRRNETIVHGTMGINGIWESILIFIHLSFNQTLLPFS
jgi:hypothetical protein